MQAIDAMRSSQVFFLLEKSGQGKEALIAARQTILDRYLEPDSYRLVTAPNPQRTTDTGDYQAEVADWQARKQALIAELIDYELGEQECGAFLLWGDPALYDSTITLMHNLAARGEPAFEFEVIPGITSVQLLTARHKLPLNRVGESITLTTARQIRCAPADTIHNAVVMLDSQGELTHLAGQQLDIYWGGYLGLPDETLLAGPLDEVREELEQLRVRLKTENGWLMDTYLLRRRTSE